MTIYIIKDASTDEEGIPVFRFWNRAEQYEASVHAETIESAKKGFREAFDLVGKSVKWVIK